MEVVLATAFDVVTTVGTVAAVVVVVAAAVTTYGLKSLCPCA